MDKTKAKINAKGFNLKYLVCIIIVKLQIKIDLSEIGIVNL